MPCCAKLLRTNSKISLFNVAQNILTVTDFEAKNEEKLEKKNFFFDQVKNNFVHFGGLTIKKII